MRSATNTFMSQAENGGLRLTAGEYIDEVLADIGGLPYQTRHTARVFAESISDPMIDEIGDTSPRSVAITCVYFADYVVRGQPRCVSQEDLMERMDKFSHVTVRRIYDRIPPLIVDHITARERNSLDSRVWETVERIAEEMPDFANRSRLPLLREIREETGVVDLPVEGWDVEQ